MCASIFYLDWKKNTGMENETEPRWTTYQYFEYSFNFVQITLYVCCFLVNLLTLTAVVKFDSLHKKPPNILIFSLAVADGLLDLYFLFSISFAFTCLGPSAKVW